MSKSKELPGIFKKGYGTISKSIMTDISLGLESKAIFAYFCALAGSGNKTFPYRSTIMKQLNISKSTYYKHFNILLKRGFISVIKSSLLLSSNTYQINVPHKDKKGYGTIARVIMQDNRLCLKAKGLYAYICSLSGKNNHAFPSKRQILKQLGISEPTYYKCLNQLKECGYVFTQQRKVFGRFSINDYYLYSLPKAAPNPGVGTNSGKKQNQKNSDTDNIDNTDWDTYLKTFLSNNIPFNNNQSSTHFDTSFMKNDFANNDPLKSFTIKLINKFFPYAPHRKIINDFLPKFRNKIKDKTDIVHLSAYMKASIRSFLEETAIKASFSKRNSSYDLEELEIMLAKNGVL